MTVDYLLHESSVGFAIFKVKIPGETIGNRLKEVQDKMQQLDTFGKMVELVSFAPWPSATEALEQINDVTEGIAPNYLKSLLEANLPTSSKKNKVTLGLMDRNLAGNIRDSFPNLQCETADTSEVVSDMLRGLRLHSEKLLKNVQEGDVEATQRSLGHAYSRAKVKFSIHKDDNHIIQAIATLDQLDKDINNLAMRVREWYGWHFPELYKIASDNLTYARLALLIGDKNALTEESLHELAALLPYQDETVAKAIIDFARISMGRDLTELDMQTTQNFARNVISLAEYRQQLAAYLTSKMGAVAPNLATLIGEVVGARLISKAGSLTNLSKMPASTVQILGAEKALFRALKTKSNTPKYGLIYHSSFIGQTPQKNKGRISRFLANKCSIASRIDNFSEVPTRKFGEALKKQVEERIGFYATGKPPTKNEVAMRSAMDSILADIDVEDPTAAGASDEEMVDGVTSQAMEQAQRKKVLKEEKKKKKRKSDAADAMDVDEAPPSKKEKKDKKEKKKHKAEVNGASDDKAEKKKRKHEANGEVDGGKKKKKSSKAA